jgi:hypothetical protein
MAKPPRAPLLLRQCGVEFEFAPMSSRDALSTAERNGDDRRACIDREAAFGASGCLTVNDHSARRPLDAAHDGAETDAPAERRRQPVDSRDRSRRRRASQPALFDVVTGRGHPQRARRALISRGSGGVESLDPLPRQPAFASEASAAGRVSRNSRKLRVAGGSTRQTAHHAIEPLEEVVERNAGGGAPRV